MLALVLWLHPLLGTHLAPSPFPLFLAAILVTSLYGGLGPGLLAAGLSMLADLVLLGGPTVSRAVQLGTFLLLALGMSALIARQRRAEQALGESEAGYRRLLETAQEGIWVLDASGRTKFVNPKLAEMLGFHREELITMPVSSFLGEDGQWIIESAGGRQPSTGDRREVKLLRKDGRSVWVLMSTSPMVDMTGRSAGVLMMVTDMTQRKAVEEVLRHQALHDALTGLPNRTLFQDRLEQAIRRAVREQEPVALLLLDLDRFKEVNDTLGHHRGDRLLKELAVQMRRMLRASDTLARLGGDEFALILPGANREDAVHTAGRVQVIREEPLRFDGHALKIEASIGIALYPEHGEDPTTLLQRADVAMYRAKRAGRGHAVYDPADDHQSVHRFALIHDLRQAIEHDQLLLHFQPTINMKTGEPGHVEALVRWLHPERGLIPPAEFIPLAEDTGLIEPLTDWVLRAALQQCSAWRCMGLKLRVAINISARTLLDPDLVSNTARTLRQHKMEASTLEVEITESTLMADPERAMTTLAPLHEMGVCITIDDFGTGYSSLAYLTQLPVDAIKVDRSFVRDMTVNAHNIVVVRAVIALAHDLGLQVVAEGVEDEETWSILATMGCDLTQGYFVSRPLPAADAAVWVRRHAQPILASRMDDYNRAKHHADDAMTRLEANYGDAAEAFQRLREAHQRGDLASELARTFWAKAGQVHADIVAARAAHDDLRRAKHQDEIQSPDSAS